MENREIKDEDNILKNPLGEGVPAPPKRRGRAGLIIAKIGGAGMETLARLMKEKRITDAKLAAKLNVAQSTVLQWRKGVYEPRASFIGKLCQELGCTPEELLGFEVTKPRELNRFLSVRLLKAVTKDGTINSERIHQVATLWRKACKNKITTVEIWLRDLAETLYKIELTEKKKESKDTGVVQLKML